MVPTGILRALGPLPSWNGVADANSVLAGQYSADYELICVYAYAWGLSGEDLVREGWPVLGPYVGQRSVGEGDLDFRHSFEAADTWQCRGFAMVSGEEFRVRRSPVGDRVVVTTRRSVRLRLVRFRRGDRWRPEIPTAGLRRPRGLRRHRLSRSSGSGRAQAGECDRQDRAVRAVRLKLDRRQDLCAEICCGQ